MYELAFCYEITGKSEDAVKYYSGFLDKNPYSKTAWFNLGVSYNKLFLYEKAILAYDYALAIDEKFASAYFNKANALANLERYDDAIETYKETFLYEHQDALAYYYIAECYEKKEQYDLALVFYNKAIKADPLLADAWLGIGISLDSLGRTAEGIHYVKKSIELQQESGVFWYVFGDMQCKLEFYEEAGAAYTKVTELEPENKDIWLDYANLLDSQGEKTKALEILAEGVKHHPDNAEILYRISACLFSVGQKQEALTFLHNALGLDYEKHSDLFEYLPQLKENTTVLDLIESYKK